MQCDICRQPLPKNYMRIRLPRNDHGYKYMVGADVCCECADSVMTADSELNTYVAFFERNPGLVIVPMAGGID